MTESLLHFNLYYFKIIAPNGDGNYHITACGTPVRMGMRCPVNPHNVTCPECMKTDIFIEAITELEIGFDSDYYAWLDVLWDRQEKKVNGIPR